MKKKFAKRLGLITPKWIVKPSLVAPPADPVGSHPGRYPKHPDPNKGQVHGGLCNITACDREDAVWWNSQTHGFYCTSCARGVNFQQHDPNVCTLVEQKPTLTEMDALQQVFWAAFYESKKRKSA